MPRRGEDLHQLAVLEVDVRRLAVGHPPDERAQQEYHDQQGAAGEDGTIAIFIAFGWHGYLSLGERQ